MAAQTKWRPSLLAAILLYVITLSRAHGVDQSATSMMLKCSRTCFSPGLRYINTVCPCDLIRSITNNNNNNNNSPLPISQRQSNDFYWSTLLDVLANEDAAEGTRDPNSRLLTQFNKLDIDEQNQRNRLDLNDELATDDEDNDDDDDDLATKYNDIATKYNGIATRYQYSQGRARRTPAIPQWRYEGQLEGQQPWRGQGRIKGQLEGQRLGQLQKRWSMHRSKKRWLDLHSNYGQGNGEVKDLWKDESGRKAFRYG